MDLMLAKQSATANDINLPVDGLIFSSSRNRPLATAISCCLPPEKFPCAAQYIAVGRCKDKLYKNIAPKIDQMDRLHTNQKRELDHELLFGI